MIPGMVLFLNAFIKPLSHVEILYLNSACLIRAGYTGQPITQTSGKTGPTNEYQPKNIHRHERINKVADKCFWSLHCTMVTDLALAE